MMKEEGIKPLVIVLNPFLSLASRCFFEEQLR